MSATSLVHPSTACGGRLHRLVAVLTHVLDGPRQPFHDLLDDDRNVRVGALRSTDHEHVGETGAADPQERLRTAAPLLLELNAVLAADVDLGDRSGDGVEARREHDDVELVVLAPGPQSGLGEGLDRVLADVDQRDVVAVEGLVVVRARRGPLRDVGVATRAQQLGRRGVVDGLADLLADELGGRVVRPLVEDQVVEGLEHEVEPAGLPTLLEDAVALGVVGHVVVRASGRTHGEAEHVVACHRPDFGVGVLDGAPEVVVEVVVLGRHDVVRGALEDRQVLGRLGDVGDRLDPRRSRADDGHALAGEVDLLLRPLRGLVHLALEGVTPGEGGLLGHGEVPERGEEVRAGEARAVFGGDGPLRAGVVVVRRGHPLAEADVAADVEAVGDEADVALDLFLTGVALDPVPGLLDLREREAVRPALAVGAGARVAVPVPGPAQVGAGLQGHGREAELLELDEHADAGEPRADHDGVGVHGRGFWVGHGTVSFARVPTRRCGRVGFRTTRGEAAARWPPPRLLDLLRAPVLP